MFNFYEKYIKYKIKHYQLKKYYKLNKYYGGGFPKDPLSDFISLRKNINMLCNHYKKKLEDLIKDSKNIDIELMKTCILEIIEILMIIGKIMRTNLFYVFTDILGSLIFILESIKKYIETNLEKNLEKEKIISCINKLIDNIDNINGTTLYAILHINFKEIYEKKMTFDNRKSIGTYLLTIINNQYMKSGNNDPKKFVEYPISEIFKRTMEGDQPETIPSNKNGEIELESFESAYSTPFGLIESRMSLPLYIINIRLTEAPILIGDEDFMEYLKPTGERLISIQDESILEKGQPILEKGQPIVYDASHSDVYQGTIMQNDRKNVSKNSIESSYPDIDSTQSTILSVASESGSGNSVVTTND